MPHKVAIVFPGQGSQKPGMGKSLFEESALVRQLFARASEACGLDLSKICFELDEEELRQTQNAQPALFITGVAAFEDLMAKLPEISPTTMAGHSIGEYAALAAAGILSLEEASAVVLRRGEIMASCGSSRPGAMAAVLGGDQEVIEKICQELTRPGAEVAVANYNCPGQLVISGDEAAVAAAEEPLKAAGCKRVTRLNVSGAFHSPLMVEGASLLAQALRNCVFNAGTVPVISNVTAARVLDSSDWAGLLERQLASPVRWVQSIERMVSEGVTRFIECGSGQVLCGLIKRICPEAPTVAYNEPSDLPKVQEVLAS